MPVPTAPEPPRFPPTPSDPLDAFERIRPELDALDGDELEPVNVDVAAASAIALAGARNLRLLVPQFWELMPAFDFASILAIEIYAYAAWWAQAVCTVTEPPDKKALLDEAVKLRTDLLVATEVLVSAGLVKAEAIGKAGSEIGYANLGEDLIKLGMLLHQVWPKISGKTPLEYAQVLRADELGIALLDRKPKRGREERSARDCDGAFLLLHRAHRSGLRVATFMRWEEGDVDEVVPSIFDRKLLADPRNELPKRMKWLGS